MREATRTGRTAPGGAGAAPSVARASGVRLGRVFGVEVHADWSVLIVFALVVYDLGAVSFPVWHPEWPPVGIYATAFAAAVLFVASILAHELSHALAAREVGVPVRRITLFMFGGVAHMDREPPSPQAELRIAIVGPITSLIIGLLGTGAGLVLTGWSLVRVAQFDPERLLASAGPVTTLLLWLGPVNLVLGAFNLVPGFPMDGGRVLRAFVWWLTGDLGRATRAAAQGGRVVALGLIGIGAFRALGGTLGDGIWLALIGWFLLRAASSSLYERRLRDALAGVPVRVLMRRHLDAVAPELSVADLVQRDWLGAAQPVFPVVRGGELVGAVGPRQLFGLAPDLWPSTPVAVVMRPVADMPAVGPDDAAERALELLGEGGQEVLLVVEGGTVVGCVGPEEILRWLQLRAVAEAA